MAGERTEKATPKRRSEAQNKGQIPKSADFNSAVMLVVGLVVISFYAPGIMQDFKESAYTVFTHLDPNQITNQNIMSFFMPHIIMLAKILLPIMMTLMIGGVVLNIAQVGFRFTTEPLMPKFDSLSPMGMANKIKGMFSMKSAVELLKSLLKLFIITVVIVNFINSKKQVLLNLLGADLTQSLSVVSSISYEMLMQIAITMLILGIADKIYQHYEFEKSIKMTKEEIKDEMKNAMGDPKIKSKIRGIQMKFAMQRMMGAVPTADVVVTNPTHYSIAIRYDTKKAPAPQVVAKGTDYIAFKIRDIAKNNNIPIVENPPLARTLYKLVPLEGMVPPDLYVAVAEVLAFVYKNNKGRRR